jgi:hypothetical protein
MMNKRLSLFTASIAVAIVTSLASCSKPPETPAASTTQQTTTTEQTTTADQGSTEKNSFRVVKDVTPPAAAADPIAMVVAVRKAPTEPTGELIRVNYPAPDKAVVTITRNGLSDDSVKATRTRYEFSAADSSSGDQKLWQMSQVTEQNKCQSGRGPEDWSGDLCK